MVERKKKEKRGKGRRKEERKEREWKKSGRRGMGARDRDVVLCGVYIYLRAYIR